MKTQYPSKLPNTLEQIKYDLVENEEYGNRCLLTATHRVLERLESENRTFAQISYPTRVERSMVDKTALREAVINAIVHNDYSLAVPLVEVFSDRITVTSAGGLVSGLSRKDFFNCRSMTRNRILMRVFRDVELVESLGSGMTRILRAYNRSIFDLTPSFLVVTFPLELLEDDMKGVTINEPINEPVKTLEEELLAVIRRKPTMSKEEFAHEIGKSRTTVTRIIQSLFEQGKIKRVGSRKTGHWEIVDK